MLSAICYLMACVSNVVAIVAIILAAKQLREAQEHLYEIEKNLKK